MPKNYSQILASYDAGNIMDWTNAIDRLNGIPLDTTSIHATYNDAIIYAATSPKAYIGQLISANNCLYLIVDTSNEKIIINGTEYDNYLKEVVTGKIDDIGVIDEIIIDGSDAKYADPNGNW